MTRRPSASAGGRAIVAMSMAGMVWMVVLTLTVLCSGERRAFGPEYEVWRQTTTGGTQPATTAITPSAGVARQEVQGGIVDQEGRSKTGSDVPRTNQPSPKQATSVPINGRVVDQAGRPVAGATVRVTRVVKAKGGDLTLWIEAIRQGRFRAADNYLIESSLIAPKEQQPLATADAQGRFRFEGFGAEQSWH